MTDEQSITTRRGFLKAAAFTAAAATVAGGGTAMVVEELGLGAKTSTAPLAAMESTSTALSPTAAQSSAPAVERVISSSNANQLVADLASVTGEKVRLESELNAAQERIALLESSLTEAADARAKMQLSLDDNIRQVGVLGGLVALYEKLDDTDIGDFVSDGLNDVGASIAGLVDDIPTVQEGLAAGRAALDNLESEIPLVEGGRIWLLGNLARIQTLFATVMTMLEVAVDRAEPLLDMMAQWTTNVLRWLPFGFGQRTANLIDAISALLDVLPESVDGSTVNVAQPLELWLGKADEPDVPLLSKVVQPIRELVLDSAETHLSKTSELRTQFNAKLQEPVQLAREERIRIRADIEAYRQKNAI